LQAGDFFTNRVLLVTESGEVRGTNSGYSSEAGEPLHARQRGGKSAWYRWTAPGDGIATFRSRGSGFDTLLAIYRGNVVSNLTEVAPGDDDTAGYFTSSISFNATNGTEYAIALDGFAGSEGNFALSWQLEPTAHVLPVLVAAPESLTVPLGEPATFAVDATGTALNYQWYFNGLLIGGATERTFTRSNVEPADVGYYNVRVRNSQGRILDSPPAVLEIGPVNFQSRDKVESLLDESGTGGGAGGPRRFVQAAAPPVQGFIAVGLGAREKQVVNNFTNSFVSPTETNHCDHIANATRWLALRPQAEAILTVDTAGSIIPTVSAIYTQSLAFKFIQLACRVDPPGSFHAPMRLPVRTNVTYLVVADGYQSATGMITFNWSLGFPPKTVVTAGEPVRLNLGECTTLHCPSEATNGVAPPPLFQWLHDGALMTGANSPSLSLCDFAPAMSGAYSLVLSNAIGIVTNSITSLAMPLHYVVLRSLFGINLLVVRGVSRDLHVRTFAVQASDDGSDWHTVVTGPLSEDDFYVEDDARSAPNRIYRVVPHLEMSATHTPSTNGTVLRLQVSAGAPVILQSADAPLPWQWTSLLTNDSGYLDVAIGMPSTVTNRFFRIRLR
jgi:hypothetical protein